LQREELVKDYTIRGKTAAFSPGTVGLSGGSRLHLAA
jgi:hypothetical protein